jgi:hypothetical protein
MLFLNHFVQNHCFFRERLALKQAKGHVISQPFCGKLTLIRRFFRERHALKQANGHVISKPVCAKPPLTHSFFRGQLALKQAKL